jgi:hypothetical protein
MPKPLLEAPTEYVSVLLVYKDHVDSQVSRLACFRQVSRYRAASVSVNDDLLVR